MHEYIGCSWVLIWMFEGLLLPVRRGDSEVVEAPETPVPEPFQPSQHRAAKAQLERVCQGPRAAEFPELAAAYKSGSKKEQREILEKFVNSGRDLGAIEATVKATREMIHAEKAGRVQMTLKDMVDANFSEFLVCTGLACIECWCFFFDLFYLAIDPRAKIQSIMSRGGEPDPNCPLDQNSYLYWVTKKKEEDICNKSTLKTQLGANVAPQSNWEHTQLRLPQLVW